MGLESLSPRGLVVNHLEGDPAERRVNAWLDGDASESLDPALLGVPFDGASTVRAGSRHGPDAVYVSVDVDSIDQSQAPGSVAPNPAGLDAGDVRYALRRLAECPQTLAMDVAEISPPLDLNNMTGNLGAMLVLNFFMGVAARQS